MRALLYYLCDFFYLFGSKNVIFIYFFAQFEFRNHLSIHSIFLILGLDLLENSRKWHVFTLENSRKSVVNALEISGNASFSEADIEHNTHENSFPCPWLGLLCLPRCDSALWQDVFSSLTRVAGV